MTKETNPLDRLLGLSLTALVEGGADLEFIATFSERYRALFAAELGVPVPQPSDLKDIIRQGVEEALLRLPAGTRSMRRPRVNLQIAGRRTSVTVDPRRWERLIAHAGGTKQARKVLEQLATQLPSSDTAANRSSWFDSQMDAYLTLAASEATPARH